MIFQFRDCELDTGRLELRRNGVVQSLEPQVFRLLAHLIENRHRVVTRNELYETIWSGRVVAESALYSRIKSARAAIGDEGQAQELIRTSNRSGYQFVADVVEVKPAVDTARASPPSGSSPTFSRRRFRYWGAAIAGSAAVLVGIYVLFGRAPAPAAPVPAIPTVAVLPFLDYSPNKDQEYFVDGLTEELTDHLSRVPGMRVVARTSSFAYEGRKEDLRKVARELGAQNLLEGSVRRDGDRLRITAQLIDANGKHIWSQTYDRPRADIFAIQEEVSSSVAAVLSVAVVATPASPSRGGTTNVDAYDAYITARAALTDPALVLPDKLAFGFSQLERATELDPHFALAWAWQAIAYHRAAFLTTHGRPELTAKANRAAARAFEIAPDDAWVLVASALASMSEHDWAAAEEKFARARASATGSENPWACSGCFALTVGRTDEALTFLREASEADPLFAANPLALAQAYEFRGEYDLADAELEACATLSGAEPRLSYQHMSLGFSRHDPALIRSSVVGLPPLGEFWRRVAVQIDRPREALATVEDRVRGWPPDAPPAWKLGATFYFAYFGEPRKALELMRSVAGDATTTRLMWHPVFSEMRKLPEFKSLIVDLKLAQYWRATGKWGDFCRPTGAGDFDFVCR